LDLARDDVEAFHDLGERLFGDGLNDHDRSLSGLV
jgi:hypothetical protein